MVSSSIMCTFWSEIVAVISYLYVVCYIIRPRHWSVNHLLVYVVLCVHFSCLCAMSVCPMNCRKWLAGCGCYLIGWVGPMICSIDGWWWLAQVKGRFRCVYWATHCNQWGICGIAVRECMKQSTCFLDWLIDWLTDLLIDWLIFGLVSGVGPRNGVLVGGPDRLWARGGFRWDFPVGLFFEKHIWFLWEKLIWFPFWQYISLIVCKFCFGNVLGYEIEVSIYKKSAKNVTVICSPLQK